MPILLRRFPHQFLEADGILLRLLALGHGVRRRRNQVARNTNVAGKAGDVIAGGLRLHIRRPRQLVEQGLGSARELRIVFHGRHQGTCHFTFIFGCKQASDQVALRAARLNSSWPGLRLVGLGTRHIVEPRLAGGGQVLGRPEPLPGERSHIGDARLSPSDTATRLIASCGSAPVGEIDCRSTGTGHNGHSRCSLNRCCAGWCGFRSWHRSMITLKSGTVFPLRALVLPIFFPLRRALGRAHHLLEARHFLPRMKNVSAHALNSA